MYAETKTEKTLENNFTCWCVDALDEGEAGLLDRLGIMEPQTEKWTAMKDGNCLHSFYDDRGWHCHLIQTL